MNRFGIALIGPMVLLMVGASNCSRERVESTNKLNEGVIAFQQKRLSDAVKLMEQAGAIDPTNDVVFLNMAIAHMEMHKYELARDDLQNALRVNPSSAGYQEKLGTVLIELQDWQAAKQALGKAVELEPGLFKAYYKLAQVDERLDDQQSALKHYTQAIEKGPRFIEAYSALGRLYAELGYAEQSVQVLTEALKVALARTEEEAQVHHLLGTVYQQQRKYDDAVREFRAALDIVPGMRDALFSLGWTYDLQGNKTDAKRLLQKFVDVAGAQAPAHYVKAARDKLSEMAEGF